MSEAQRHRWIDLSTIDITDGVDHRHPDQPKREGNADKRTNHHRCGAVIRTGSDLGFSNAWQVEVARLSSSSE